MSYFDDVIEPKIINGTYYTKGRNMSYEQKEGDLVIFKVKEKKSDKGPDWTGKALIDGKQKDVALWIKGDTGTMLAGSVKPKFVPNFDEAKQAAQGKTEAHKQDAFEDEIPWN